MEVHIHLKNAFPGGIETEGSRLATIFGSLVLSFASHPSLQSLVASWPFLYVLAMKFLKISCIVIVYSKFSSALTCENLYLLAMKFLES